MMIIAGASTAVALCGVRTVAHALSSLVLELDLLSCCSCLAIKLVQLVRSRCYRCIKMLRYTRYRIGFYD